MVTVKLDEIIIEDKVINSFNNISKSVRLGSQYLWLAMLPKKFGVVEMGIEKPRGEYSGCVDAINKFGRLKSYEDSYIIDKENSTQDLINLFGSISFPIIKLTEIEMKKL